MIEIKTRLAQAIYRSHGGGQTHTVHSWATAPLNLLRALRLYPHHRARMTRDYGLGHEASWIEIDGVVIRDDDLLLMDLDYVRDCRRQGLPHHSRTQLARELIAEAQSGALLARYRDFDASMEASDAYDA